MTKRRGISILCIGDDPVSLNLRCSLLRQQGWKVISSGSGHEGVFRFSQERVDVVVLDLDRDGAELALIAAELKRQRSQLPIIMLVPEEKALVQGATQQADAVVVKSQESRQLIDALKALLPDLTLTTPHTYPCDRP